MPSVIQADLLKDASATKTLATLSSSAVTLHSDVTFPAGHVVGHKTITVTQTTQVTSSGSFSELDTDLRLTYTAKSSSNKLLFYVYAWFCSQNSSNLAWAYIYNITDSGVFNAPPASGSRYGVHWAKRTTPADNNDYDTINFQVYGDAPSGEKTYTIHHGTEGVTHEFYRSTLDSSGVTAPITFTVFEIQQ